MKFTSKDLWETFKQEFKLAFEKTDRSSLFEIWKDDEKWTNHYFTTILPKLQSPLKMIFKKEYPFRVDGVFLQIGEQKQEVPIIYIESENDITTSDREIVKLCSVNSPLKILLTYSNIWSTSKDLKNNIIDGYWQYIIEDYQEQLGLTGYTAIIIVEKINDGLNFHSYVFDADAKLIEDNLMFGIKIA